MTHLKENWENNTSVEVKLQHDCEVHKYVPAVSVLWVVCVSFDVSTRVGDSCTLANVPVSVSQWIQKEVPCCVIPIHLTASQKTDMLVNIWCHLYVDVSKWTLTAVLLLLMSLRSIMKVKSLLSNRWQLNGERMWRLWQVNTYQKDYPTQAGLV